MAKSPDAFRTIGEVAAWLETPTHVLRFWESRFSQISPVKGAGGRRYYRPADMALIGGIKQLLHEDGMTIRGVQNILRKEGVEGVASRSPPVVPAEDAGTPGATAAEAPAADDAPAGQPAEAPGPATQHAGPSEQAEAGETLPLDHPGAEAGTELPLQERRKTDPAGPPPAPETEPAPASSSSTGPHAQAGSTSPSASHDEADDPGAEAGAARVPLTAKLRAARRAGTPSADTQQLRDIAARLAALRDRMERDAPPASPAHSG